MEASSYNKTPHSTQSHERQDCLVPMFVIWRKKTLVFCCLALLVSVEGTNFCTNINVNSNVSECIFNETVTALRGQIRSTMYPISTLSAYCEQWHIVGHVGQVITISFVDFDVSPSDSDCNETFVVIGPEPCRVYCGDRYPLSYISAQSDVFIKYVYRESGPALRRGFILTYNVGSYLSTGENCLDDEFECIVDRKCIPRSWMCNGAAECSDSSDESPVNCQQVTVQPFNPPTDYACGENNFGCIDAVSRVYRCFHNVYKCDGVTQCVNNFDELKCDAMNRPCRMHWLSESTGWLSTPLTPFNCSTTTTGCTSCTSIIFLSSTASATIQLRFRTFHLVPGEYINIHDGGSANDRVIGQLTANSRPERIIESSGRWIYLTFHSVSSRTSFFNLTFQEKGICLADQFVCLHGERDCYEFTDRCNGVWDCPLYGADEYNCKDCRAQYYCGPASGHCYTERQRCNGVEDCLRLADELHCSADRCGHHNGTFLCASEQCIRENFVCDGRIDCVDGSDELNCPLSTKVILSAVVGSLTCGLLLVIALGIAHRFYVLRLSSSRRVSSRHISPITAIEEHIYAQRSAPPPYPEAMATSRPYEEYQREVAATRLCLPSPVTTDSLPSQTPLVTVETDRSPGIVSNSDDDLIDVAGDDNISDTGGVGIVGCLALWQRRPKPPAAGNITAADAVGESVAMTAGCHSDSVVSADSVVAGDDTVVTDDRSLLIC